MPSKLISSLTLALVMVFGCAWGDVMAQEDQLLASIDALEQPDIELNEENYELWRDHILPDSSELAWQEIPWLTTFKDGILAAQAANKPLLLWTMNGHPLGCT